VPAAVGAPTEEWLSSMGNRSVLFLTLAVGAVAVATAILIVLRATSHLGPSREVAVLDQPGVPASVTHGVADFTVIDPPRPAPAAAFGDVTGQARTLADFHGRVVLLNLWATWCAPCVQEMPALDRLQAQLGGPDFAVVALSQDRQGADIVKPFYAKQGLTHLDIALDTKGAVPRELGVQALPVSFLIDRQGRLVGRLEGAAAWDSAEWIALMKRTVAAPATPGS
jgi:thiol-disulfide isomerase/thioredoxin